MAVRLAVTVAGAVSLGSYEAGVLYEVLDAIAQHNAGVPEASKILVDVLTGASAGGMSATVLAQKLMFEADSLADPYNNTLYRAWVQDIDIEGLLALQSDEDPSHSILSSNLVETLSAKYLCQRYSTHIPPAPVKHAAAAGAIRLGLALSNLNGIDYSYKVKPNGTFTYTHFEDQLYAKVDSSSDTLDFWEPLRNAAVSCGAFPFAFRVKDLVRHRSEFDSPNVVFPMPFETFTYTDGGVFQNEPLGLAKNLVDEVDQHVNTDSRFYLFIAPHVKGSTAHADFIDPQLKRILAL
jgi:Patatin-like phospholipase